MGAIACTYASTRRTSLTREKIERVTFVYEIYCLGR